MKKVYKKLFGVLLFISAFGIISCSIDGFGEEEIFIAWLSGNVIGFDDNLSMTITKDDILEYAENNCSLYQSGYKDYMYKTIFYIKIDGYGYHYSSGNLIAVINMQIYLQPIYDNKRVICFEYPHGIPMTISSNAHMDYIEDKPILMTNGYVELADSSYNGYIILPVAPNSTGAAFDKKKCSFELRYKDENGNFRELNKEYFKK
jgi:hypothetical protein